jgi:5'(3')-deoxyribonucleotidase
MSKENYSKLSAYALRQIAKAADFEDNSPRSWTEILNEIEQDLQLFKSSDDFHKETNLYLLNHVGFKVMKLIDQYRTAPNFDDRYKPYMNLKRIVLDVDDVVADFTEAFTKRYNINPKSYWDGTYNIGKMLDEIKEDKDFYINLKVKYRPNFMPYAYVSSRSIPVEWTETFLEMNDLPCRPVYHVPFNTSKLEVLKSLNTEIFIDDKFDNFAEALGAGITAFLMDAPHNQHYNVGFRRIFSLDIKNIIR